MDSWAGNLIKLTRLETGLSQRELARQAGTSQATIAAYEAGRKSPTMDTLLRIVRAAGRDLRIELVPADAHDEVVRAYEARLPDKVVAKHRAQRRRHAERARAQRGLATGRG